MVRWLETEALALDRVTARLQGLVPFETLSRPRVLKLLVASAVSGVPVDDLLTKGGA